MKKYFILTLLFWIISDMSYGATIAQRVNGLFCRGVFLDQMQKNLIDAVKEGDIVTVKQLSDLQGIDINVKDVYDYTALMWASLRGREKIISFLIESGADLNYKNKDGFTALNLAVTYKHSKIVEQLEEAGAVE